MQYDALLEIKSEISTVVHRKFIPVSTGYIVIHINASRF